MSAYPECKHGHNHPMHRCEQCDLENELDQLREENQQLREQAAAIAAAREALEYTLKRLNGAGAEWFDDPHFGEPLTEKVIRTLALLNGQKP